MRVSLLLALSLMACGGRVQGDEATTDAAVDTAVDTRSPERDSAPPPRDTRPPEPTSCAIPLSPDFACTDPAPRPGKTVCTDAQMQIVIDGCFGDGASSSKCEDARKKVPACASCMLEDWIVDEGRLGIAQCIQKIDPMSPCARSVECEYDCLGEVCIDCDYSPGSGTGGGSEVDDCWQNESEGKCGKFTDGYTACVSDPKFSVCVPSTVADVLPFYRGACRDGGNWSRAYDADTVGVDAGSAP